MTTPTPEPSDEPGKQWEEDRAGQGEPAPESDAPAESGSVGAPEPADPGEDPGVDPPMDDPDNAPEPETTEDPESNTVEPFEPDDPEAK